MSVLWDLLVERMRRSPSEPMVTWYGIDGARSELSAVTFATAVAKTAGALLDEWEVPPGSSVRLDLPLHWQGPVWLAACDLAGLTVAWDDDPVDVVVAPDPDTAAAGGADFQVVTTCSAFGLPGPPLPAPLLDHARDAMGQPDVFLSDPDSGQWRHGREIRSDVELLAAAGQAAARVGLATRGRLLIIGERLDADTALAAWAVPLAARAGCVLAPDLDAATAEQITGTWRPEP